jgi:hypothetical protein
MKIIAYIITFFFFSIAAEPKSEHKAEVANWHNKYLSGKIGQKEISLLAQRMHYMFNGIEEAFKDKKIDKVKIPISNALNEINTQIKKLDKGDIAKAFEQINQRLKVFKSSKGDAKETILDFFDYLEAIYEILYSQLKNKKITIGSDKNKKLPTIDKIKLPNEQEVKLFLKNTKFKIKLKTKEVN